MRSKYHHIKIAVLLILVGFLYAFSSARNSSRKVSEPIVLFSGTNNLFVSHQNVSKLLIQSDESVANKPKETIDLNGLEMALNLNPLIRDAQVYLSVDGVLTAVVEQKKPIARVTSDASFYVDEDGLFMPLSENYTARVPVVTGIVDKNDLENLSIIAHKVQNDEFLRTQVVGIHQHEDLSIDLKFRLHDFVVKLGSLKQLDKKINNLKAFYQKAMRDKTLDNYSIVNLRFDKQVICTKK